MDKSYKLILAITGASGAIYGLRALQVLRNLGVEVHLIISPTGYKVIEKETDFSLNDIENLSEHIYSSDDFMAPIASGSFHTDGMLIVPCSIKTLAGVANCFATNLILRSADVCLKEGQPLLLGIRETPFHYGHIQQMSLASQAGAIIFPLIPSFYNLPTSIDEIIDNLLGRILSRMGIENDLYKPWQV